MPIQFYPEKKIFKLDTKTTSYILQVGNYGYLLHHYYGAWIPDAEIEYISYIASHGAHFPRVEMESVSVPYFCKDTNLMEYSCNGCGDFRGSDLL